MKRVRLEIERPGSTHTMVWHGDDLTPEELKIARDVLKDGARIKSASFLTYTAPKVERVI